MNIEVTPMERLILWRLAAAGGGEWNPDLKPAIAPSTRKRLLDSGLVETKKLQREGKRGKTLLISLSDNGWAFLGKQGDGPIPPRANGIPTLSRLLAKLDNYIKTCDVSLAEIINPIHSSGGARPAVESDDRAGLDARIEEAYLKLSRGETNVRVRLSDLRGSLADVPRARLDAALLDLAGRGNAALYRLDMPWEIGPADREAVLLTPSGEERHIIYLGGRGS